jgi:tetratricopeptide (TPR) repeat protein
MSALPFDLLASATAALRQGNVRQAAADGGQAAELFWQRGDTDGRMRSLNLLGAVAFEEGALEEARERFDGALGLARSLGDTQLEARAHNNLASVAHLRGDALEALSLYRAALLSYQRLGDRRGAGETCHNLGLVFRELGALNDADEATEQALRHAEVSADSQLLALAVMGRAELDLARGAFDMAARAVARAEELMTEAHDAAGAAEVARLRALVALKRGQTREAAAEALRGADVARSLDSQLLVAELTAIAALALRRDGLNELADGNHAEALAGFERLGAAGLSAKFSREWDALS